MKLTYIRRGLLLLGGFATAVGVAPGCQQPDSEIFIRGVMVPAQAPDCSFRPDPGALLRSIGYLDVSFAPSGADYVATLLIGNSLVSRGSNDLVRTETSRVVLHSADVRITDTAGGAINSYSVPIAGFIDPSAGGEPGYGMAAVPLLDGPTAALLSGGGETHRIVSNVRVFGTTLGGSEVRSEEYSYVLFTCKGCLVSFPASSVDAQTGACKGGSGETSTTAVTPCIYGQDDAVDCTLCAASNPSCKCPGGMNCP